MLGMHKAIFFDLGKVLIHFDFRRGYRALEGLCPYKAEEIPRRLAGTGLVERFETGLVEPRDFVQQMSGILDLRVDYDQFRDDLEQYFYRDSDSREHAGGPGAPLPPGAAFEHQRASTSRCCGKPTATSCAIFTTWCCPMKFAP